MSTPIKGRCHVPQLSIKKRSAKSVHPVSRYAGSQSDRKSGTYIAENKKKKIKIKKKDTKLPPHQTLKNGRIAAKTRVWISQGKFA